MALLIVTADFWLVWSGSYSYLKLRAALPPIALGLYLVLGRGDLASVGLKARPLPDVRYWLGATLPIVAVIGAPRGGDECGDERGRGQKHDLSPKPWSISHYANPFCAFKLPLELFARP